MVRNTWCGHTLDCPASSARKRKASPPSRSSSRSLTSPRRAFRYVERHLSALETTTHTHAHTISLCSGALFEDHRKERLPSLALGSLHHPERWLPVKDQLIFHRQFVQLQQHSLWRGPPPGLLLKFAPSFLYSASQILFFLLFKALILLYFSLSRNIISPPPFPPLYFSLYSSCLITITYIGPISGVFFSSPDPGEKRVDNRVYVWVLVLGGGVLCWKEIANSAKGCEERICYMVRGSFYFLFCCLFVFADSCRFSFLPPVA